MRVKSIAEAFASYQAAVIPPDAPAVVTVTELSVRELELYLAATKWIH